MENPSVVLVKVEEDDDWNDGMPEQALDTHSEETRKRSAEPVSRMTSYATGGVPTAIEP
jgi:hypothetical protein